MDFLLPVLLALALVGFIIVGAGLGIAAFNRSRRNSKELRQLLLRLMALEKRLGQSPPSHEVPAQEAEGPSAVEMVPRAEDLQAEGPALSGTAKVPDIEQAADPVEETPVPLAKQAAYFPPPLPPGAAPTAKQKTSDGDGRSLELALGQKWMAWVGVLMVMIGVGFGLKYAYDRGVVPPEIRLALGYLFGLAGLGVAEVFRRRGHAVMFQTLTGGGIGILYLCVFVSYRIYEFTGPGLSMGLGILVTGLGVVMAVAHNALPIAVLAVIGGFMTPLLFSDGGDRPVALFTYIALLDLVALGAAYYRRWRALDLLCFAGTVILYQLWYTNSYTSENLTVALVFTSLFYVMFLLIPTVYSLTRRVPMETGALALVIVNALYSFYAYYGLLLEDYRLALGFVVIAQAMLVFLLFYSWSKRVSATDRTAESFLVITLALVTLAVPIQLRLYGIPIAWSVEGALFVYLGLRFERRTCTLGGLAALALAAGALMYRLPLHELPFTPIFNPAFGSWVVVIAAAICAAFLLHRAASRDSGSSEIGHMAIGAGLLAYVLACLLASLELATFWTVNQPEGYRQALMASLTALWAFIPAATAAVIVRRELDTRAFVLPWIGYGIGAALVVAGLTVYEGSSTWFSFNKMFLADLVLLGCIWSNAFQSRRVGQGQAANVLETGSYVLLALLLAAEFNRWGDTAAVSQQLARALLSCAWALEAFALIWFGLATRLPLRRILGFVLFGVTVLHVVFIAWEAKLDPALQIVSFIGSGLFLLAAAAFYSRFSRMLLAEEKEGENEPS